MERNPLIVVVPARIELLKAAVAASRLLNGSDSASMEALR